MTQQVPTDVRGRTVTVKFGTKDNDDLTGTVIAHNKGTGRLALNIEGEIYSIQNYWWARVHPTEE